MPDIASQAAPEPIHKQETSNRMTSANDDQQWLKERTDYFNSYIPDNTLEHVRSSGIYDQELEELHALLQ